MISSNHDSKGWAMLHIALGFTALRLGVRLTLGTQPPLRGNPSLVAWAAMTANLAVSVVILAVPLAGAIV
jgi:cytochrome b561